MAAASRALNVAVSTVQRRVHKIPALRGLADAGGALAAHTRLRIVQLMGRALDRCAVMLDSPDEKVVLAAARLLGGWSTSGAYAAPTRAVVEERTPRPVSPDERIQELARAQCTPSEIAACLVVEHGHTEAQAQARIAELGTAILAHARQGRAIIRARAMAMSEDPRMVQELARQHAYWSRSGYADEVGAAVERAEEQH